MRIDVLDHGYVALIEAYGTGDAGVGNDARLENPDYECGIIEAARQSTQGAFRGWNQDAKLLKYLHDNHHATPFEFSGMVIEVQAPIFVFREWHRHRTQSYNEASARYAPLPDLYYSPTLERVAETGRSHSAQAATTGTVADRVTCAEWLEDLNRHYADAERLYQRGLRDGIPKELARLCMPVGHYSKMRASANLRNWLAFLTLRQHPAAQWEIRQYANAVGKLIEQTFPQTWANFSVNQEAKP